MVHNINNSFDMILIQYNEYSISIVDTDDLVLWHQGISNNSAEYTSNAFPAVYGLKISGSGNGFWPVQDQAIAWTNHANVD